MPKARMAAMRWKKLTACRETHVMRRGSNGVQRETLIYQFRKDNISGYLPDRQPGCAGDLSDFAARVRLERVLFL
jgi:hypothetical protein